MLRVTALKITTFTSIFSQFLKCLASLKKEILLQLIFRKLGFLLNVTHPIIVSDYRMRTYSVWQKKGWKLLEKALLEALGNIKIFGIQEPLFAALDLLTIKRMKYYQPQRSKPKKGKLNSVGSRRHLATRERRCSTLRPRKTNCG